MKEKNCFRVYIRKSFGSVPTSPAGGLRKSRASVTVAHTPSALQARVAQRSRDGTSRFAIIPPTNVGITIAFGARGAQAHFVCDSALIGGSAHPQATKGAKERGKFVPAFLVDGVVFDVAILGSNGGGIGKCQQKEKKCHSHF